jgi:hypothetical protein
MGGGDTDDAQVTGRKKRHRDLAEEEAEAAMQVLTCEGSSAFKKVHNGLLALLPSTTPGIRGLARIRHEALSR